MPQYPSVIELSSLNGATGFQINGELAGDQIAMSIRNAGDINGDGLDDFIIGASRKSPGGAAYVVFGRSSGFPATLELSSLNGATGFRILPEASGDALGFAVSGAGDVNGDGIDDIIVGARGVSANGSHSGASYVIFGKATPFASNFSLATLNGANGFQINGVTAGDYSGHAVASAGDVNNDGFDDLVIGAPFSSQGGTLSGAAYVVFGKASGFKANFELSALNGANGFALIANEELEVAASFVGSAGDLNGDGFDDVIIGASSADHAGYNSGSAYVIFGSPGAFASSLALSDLNGVNGFRIDGEKIGDLFGFPAISAGDVNGDGIGDLVIAASSADPNGGGSGTSYVIFGKNAAFDPTFDLASLDGSNGFRIHGETNADFSGYGVSSAGDVNGDGFSDVIIGAKGSDKNASYAGASYVVFGQAGGFASAIELSSLNGANGFRIDGELMSDGSGWSVSSAGDMNGDGLSDLAVGAPLADPHSSFNGAAYIVFARQPDTAVNRTGTNAGQMLAGGPFKDTLSGLGGEDELWGNGGNDSLAGGVGDDTVRGGNGDDTLDESDVAFGDSDLLLGGAGNDLYRLNSFVAAYTPIVKEALNQGTDTVELFDSGVLPSVSYAMTANVEFLTYTGSAKLTVRGNDLANKIIGGTGADRFLADAGGADLFNGGDGVDTMDFAASATGIVIELATGTTAGAAAGDKFALIEAFAGSNSAADKMTGNAPANIFFGNGGNDTLSGVNGDDTLRGGAGNDMIDGGLGRDELRGEAGADIFDYDSTAESAVHPASRDTIFAFESNATDRIDLSGIDAIAGGGAANDKFSFIDAAQFSATGQIRVTQAGGNTFIDGNTGGDKSPDFRIIAAGLVTIDGADFIL